MSENERSELLQEEVLQEEALQAENTPAAEEVAAKNPLDKFLPPHEERKEMKKKIAILVFLLLCVGAMIVLVLLRAGTPIVDFWTVAGSVDTVDTEIDKVQRIESISGSIPADTKGILSLYEKTDDAGLKTQYVLNTASGTVVATLADTETLEYTVKLNLAGGAAWYSVRSVATSGEAESLSLMLCDASGSAFAKKENLSRVAYDALAYDTGVLDLVLLEREVFRADKNGVFKRAFTLDAFATLPQFEKKVGSYYYIEESDTYYIYDASASLTATYRVPSAAQDFRQFYLSDGTLLMQYITAEGEHTDDYTYTENGEKYKLHHILVSAKNGERTELKNFPIYVEMLLSDGNVFRALGLNANMDNFAIGYPVQDGVLEKDEYHVSSILLSNRGRVTSTVGKIIPAMQGGMILGIAKNRWLAQNLADECYLLNEWGSVIGRFPSEYQSQVQMAARIFIYDEKIYDWNLTLLYDMKENEVLSHELIGSSVLMRKDKGEVLLYDANKKEIVSLLAPESEKEAITLGGALIAIKETVNGAVRQTLYNEGGKALTEIEADALALIASYAVNGGTVIEFSATKGTEVEYYLASTED